MFNTIKARLLLLLSFLLIFTIFINLVTTKWIVEKSQKESAFDSLKRTEQVVRTLIGAQNSNLLNQSKLVGILPILTTVVENGDKATILHSARQYQQQLKLPIFDILDDEGDLLVSVKKNFSLTSSSQRSYLINKALEEGKVQTSLIIRQNRLSLIAVAPVGLPEEPTGALLIGTYLDNRFSKKIQQLTKAHISFLIGDHITGSSLTQKNQTVLLKKLNTLIPNFKKSHKGFIKNTETHLIWGKALKGINGKIIGKIIIQFSLEESKRILAKLRVLTFLVGGIIFCIVMMISFVFTLKVLIQPIEKLKGDAYQLAQGKLEHPINTKGKDELGSLARSFSNMRDSIRKKVEDLNILNNTGEILAGQFDQRRALEIVLQVIHEKTKVDRGSVYLLNDRNELEIKSFYPFMKSSSEHPSKTFDLGEGVLGKVAQNKKIIYIPDTSKSTDFIFSEEETPRALLCIPLLDGKKIFGVMNFSGKVGGTSFDDTDEKFSQALARMTVVTTKNIQMVNVIEEQNRTLEDKVKERTQAIQDLMDNTGEGFFSFDKNYLIHPEYSKPCQTFFGGTIGNFNALDLLFANPEMDINNLREELKTENAVFENQKGESAKELLDMILNGTGNMTLLGDLLPKETTRDNRTLSLEYRLIHAMGSNESKFMMILSDVTKERELAALIATEEARHAMILKVALYRDGFLQFLRELEHLFMMTYASLGLPIDEIDTNELFRYYHTIKGGTASYGLTVVAEKTHEIEASLEDVRSGKGKLTSEMVVSLLDSTLDTQQLLRDSFKELKGIISEDELAETERIYHIKQSEVLRLKQFLLKKVKQEDLEQVKNTIDDFCKQPINSILKKYVAIAEDLAEKLNKPIQTKLKGKNLRVLHDQLEGLFGSLIHLIRNCVDHGLEESEIRVMLGKPEIGTITIEAAQLGNSLQILISDDGGGIDSEQIKNIALKKGIIDEEFILSASENDLNKLIFAPGFSTKEAVSDISGRGVGMDAVQASVNELSGKIEVKTILEEGTTFEITIPNIMY